MFPNLGRSLFRLVIPKPRSLFATLVTMQILFHVQGTLGKRKQRNESCRSRTERLCMTPLDMLAVDRVVRRRENGDV